MEEKKSASKVVDKMLSRVGKNIYTQSVKRIQVANGYGDCSSTVQWAYQQGAGIQIGGYTVAQITAANGRDVDTAKGPVPDETNLLPGDLLFFKGADKSRPFQVGHVEMYIGKGRTCGHGSGKGPVISDMNAYCKSRYDRGRGYIKARRFIFQQNSDEDNSNSKENNSTVYTVKNGDSLWSISARYLGSGARYKEVAAASRLKSEIIRPGQKLVIPMK